MLAQLAGIFKDIYQDAFSDGKFPRLARHREAGFYLVRDKASEDMGRNDDMEHLVHRFVIGLAFNIERRHRFRDGEIARLGDTLAALMGNAQAPALDEPEHGDISRILPDMRPGAPERKPGLGLAGV